MINSLLLKIKYKLFDNILSTAVPFVFASIFKFIVRGPKSVEISQTRETKKNTHVHSRSGKIFRTQTKASRRSHEHMDGVINSFVC